MTWTTTADSAAPAWLSVFPVRRHRGYESDTFTSAGLAPGTYTKTVIVAAPGAVNTPQTATVTLSISRKR